MGGGRGVMRGIRTVEQVERDEDVRKEERRRRGGIDE